VGGGVGYLVDSGKPDHEVASRADLLVQKGNAEVLVADRDGAVHRGRYRGIRAESGEPYALAYEGWRVTLPDSFMPPPVGGGVVLWVRTDGRLETREGELLGVDADAVYLGSRGQGMAVEWAVIESWTDARRTPYALPTASDDANGTLPLIASVELLVGSETVETIRWGNIRTVEVKRAKHGMRNGAIVGLTLDALALVVVALTWEDSSGSWSLNWN
jgi:hypothetical protein